MLKLFKVNIYVLNKVVKNLILAAETAEKAIEMAKKMEGNELYVSRGDVFGASEVEVPNVDMFLVPHGKENYIRWYGTPRALCIEKDMLIRLLDYIDREEYEALKTYIGALMYNMQRGGNNLNGNQMPK